MKKILATLAAAATITVCAQSANAAFTLFDLAKDSMYVARGEFTELERTNGGDRLTLRCNNLLKGDLAPGTTLVLESFEPAPADEALGRDVIVGFNLINGKYYFNLHPYSWRSFYFEDTDEAADGLNRNETAIKNFVSINAPHQAVIERELRKRLEYGTLAYEGEYDKALVNEWKAELLRQLSAKGSVAARDAAKAFIDHALFRNTLTVEEIQYVGSLVKGSQIGSLERSYMLEIIRNEFSAHPPLATQLVMLREETTQMCVGKLSNLFSAVENREAVIAAIGEMAAAQSEPTQVRVNALQTLAAMRDLTALPYVHTALLGEQNASDFNKDVVRGALKALRRLHSADNEALLETYIATEQCQTSWELTRRAWIAYSMIDSTNTNIKIRQRFQATSANDVAHRKFFGRLLESNKVSRELLMVFNED